MGTLASSPRSLDGRGSSGEVRGREGPGQGRQSLSVFAPHELWVSPGEDLEGREAAGGRGRPERRGDEGTWAAGAVGAPRGSLWRRTEQSSQHPGP